MGVPTFDQWLRLSEKERAHEVARLNGYDGVGAALIEHIAERFREEFGHLPGIQIDGPGIPQGGGWVIAVTHDFIFDRRWLPSYYLGVPVKASCRPPLPAEFANQQYPAGYVWTPPNFERFVDRCAHEIRERLGSPNMSREEMLHALIGMPFDKFVAQCRAWVSQGTIPPFE
jgi:hypothetical protein